MIDGNVRAYEAGFKHGLGNRGKELDRIKKAGQELVKALCEPVDAHATLPWLDQRAKALDEWNAAVKGECDD